MRAGRGAMSRQQPVGRRAQAFLIVVCWESGREHVSKFGQNAFLQSSKIARVKYLIVDRCQTRGRVSVHAGDPIGPGGDAEPFRDAPPKQAFPDSMIFRIRESRGRKLLPANNGDEIPAKRPGEKVIQSCDQESQWGGTVAVCKLENGVTVRIAKLSDTGG